MLLPHPPQQALISLKKEEIVFIRSDILKNIVLVLFLFLVWMLNAKKNPSKLKEVGDVDCVRSFV